MNEAKDEQEILKSDIEGIKKYKKEYFFKDNREARTNIEHLYEARKAVIDFLDKYTSRASEARRQAKQGTGLKILTPKQMLQRFPIALTQIKAGNNSEVY